MRHKVLFFLIALMLVQLDVSAAVQPPNSILDNADSRLEFKQVPLPEVMKQKIADQTLAAGGGNEFYCILPPNDRSTNTVFGNLSIYICSGSDCSPTKPIDVTVTRGTNNTPVWEGTIDQPGFSIALTATNGTGISNPKSVLEQKWEVLYDRTDFSSNTVVRDKGFRITSVGGDVFVYVGSFSQNTADGYMVLPTHLLGNRYIHCSRKDNLENDVFTEYPEQNTNIQGDYRTGFSCIATVDNTIIRTRLTSNLPMWCISYDRLPADGITTVTSPSLNRNEVWSVVNGINPYQNQACDFTGSIVESNKNFAMISWVQRTAIPVMRALIDIGLGRDNLVEQLLPTRFWGKEFVSVQFKGSYESASHWKDSTSYWLKNPGNCYRVVASEPGTEFNVLYYDMVNFQTMAKWGGRLVNAGDWREKGEGLVPASVPNTGIGGAAYWTANLPIQVMQYSVSKQVHYNHETLDPCMVLVPPVEQYGHNTTFKTAPETNSSNFTEHFVSLYIKGPVDENNQHVDDYAQLDALLKGVRITENGNMRSYDVIQADNTVHGNHIPGTNYYFARWQVPADATVYIEAKTDVSGMAYGFGGAISYAWPTAMGLVEVGVTDSYPPKVENTYNCSIPAQLTNGRIDTNSCEVIIRSQWWDTVFIPGNDFQDAIEDFGISRQPDLREETDNLEDQPLYSFIEPSLPPDWAWPNTRIKQGYVEYTVTNPYEDVIGAIHYEDTYGHTTVETMIYVADKLRFYDKANDPQLTNPITSINFGSVVNGTTATRTVVVKNINTADINVFETLLSQINMRDGDFTITVEDKTTLEPGETVEITISYTPTTNDNVDDLLCVYTQCLLFGLNVYAGSGYPMIRVSDIPCTAIPLNTTSAALPFTIHNPGSLDLTITGATFTPAQPAAPSDTFEFVTAAGGIYLTTLPTVDNPWVIGPNETVTGRITFYAHIADTVEATLCFESDAVPALDADYDNCVNMCGTGISNDVQINDVLFGLKRVCSENEETVTITNGGNFPIVLLDIVGSAGTIGDWATYRAGSDTLFSKDSSYFITGINAIKGDTLQPQSSFNLQVHFNPLSEFTPYGNAVKNLSYTVSFGSVTGAATTITATAQIQGEAYQPKLNVNDYTFPNSIKYGTWHNPDGAIVLENPSWTWNTTIYSITVIQADQWDDFTIVNAGTVPPVPKQEATGIGRHSITVRFNPKTADPVDRQCRVIIESDAYECNTTGEIRRYDTIWLRGTAFDDSWMVNNPDLGTFARCEEPVMPISVSNDGTEPLRIDSVTVDPRYSGVLVLEDGITFPVTVPANDADETLRFRFEACNYVDGSGNPAEGVVSIPVTVHTNMGSQVATFAANPLYIPVTITLPRFATAPGVSQTIPIEIAIANTDNQFYNFDNAQIRGFTIVLNVKHSQLHFEGMFEFISANGWQFEIVSQTDDQVTIRGTSTGEPLQAGAMVYPYAIVMVGTDGIIPISVASVTFDRDCCIRLMSTESGELTFDICAQVPRGDIVNSNTEYTLAPITPTPFVDRILNIDYSIGLDAKTTIKIFNSNGDLVKVAVDEYQKTGAYTASVNVGDLSSGIYSVTISSGPFEESQSLVIVR